MPNKVEISMPIDPIPSWSSVSAGTLGYSVTNPDNIYMKMESGSSVRIASLTSRIGRISDYTGEVKLFPKGTVITFTVK